jgi:hypothetical protein
MIITVETLRRILAHEKTTKKCPTVRPCFNSTIPDHIVSPTKNVMPKFLLMDLLMKIGIISNQILRGINSQNGVYILLNQHNINNSQNNFVGNINICGISELYLSSLGCPLKITVYW